MPLTYLLIKALHVVAVISWMAAMLYLPRLMVYHAEAAPGSEHSERLKVMERRLLKAIMTPAMLVTWITGLIIAWAGGWFVAPWLWVKILLVVGLSAVHGMNARWVKDFAADANIRPQRFYRIANEVPTALMIAIVLCVIVWKDL